MHNTTSTSVHVTCLPGQDNGAKQQFALQVNDDKFRVVLREHADSPATGFQKKDVRLIIIVLKSIFSIILSNFYNGVAQDFNFGKP